MALFREMDVILNEIRQSYMEMDKFWVDEVRRVTKVFKDCRIDPKDIDRWKSYRDDLEKTIAHWEVCVSLRHSSLFFFFLKIAVYSPNLDCLPPTTGGDFK